MKKINISLMLVILILSQVILVSKEIKIRSSKNSVNSAKISEKEKGNSSRSNIPPTIAHQGVIKDDGLAISGNHDLSFAIYSVSTGGTPLWTETQSGVSFSEGIFNVILGSVTPIDLDFDIQYYIGVSIDTGDEFLPRVQLTTSPYSFNAKKADLADVASDIETDVAVTSLNGKQNSVSITAGENIAIDNSGADIIISADLSSVSDNDELVKVGAAGDPGYLSNSDFTSSTKEISKKSNTKDAISNSRSNKGVISIKENAITESKLDINNSASDGFALTYDSGTSKMMWKDVDTMVDGDNLGNHTATQNIRLNGNILSNDGSPNGLSIENGGEIYILREGAAKIIMSYQGMSMNDVDGGVYINKANGYGFKIARAGNPSWPLVSNLNNGFEVQGAEDFGMFIGRADSTGINIESTGYDGIVIKNAGMPSSVITSNLKNGIEIQGAEGYGLYVGQADMDGIHINKANGAGIFVNEAIGDGIHIRKAGTTSNIMWSATNNGIEIAGAENSGVLVNKADKTGLKVIRVGNASGIFFSEDKNGIEVGSIEGNGVYIGKVDLDGMVVINAGAPTNLQGSNRSNGIEIQGAEGSGFFVGQADYDGLEILSTGNNGIEIISAGANGVKIVDTVNDGVTIENSGKDGFQINNAGSSTSSISSSLNNGLEVQGAEGNGVYIGQADEDGIHIIRAEKYGLKIDYAGYSGVSVNSAVAIGVYLNSIGSNGFHVANAGSNGVYVGQAENGITVNTTNELGLKVISAGTDGIYIVESGDDGATIYGDDKGVIGATTNVNDEYGIYTNDKMYCGAGYMGSKMFSVGKNTGSETLEPGDLVVFAGGYEEEVLGEKGEIPVINVKKAGQNSANSIFGVVEYSVEIKEEFEELKTGMTRIEKSFTKADYDEARSGDYVSIVILGPADVKVGDRTESIEVGATVKLGSNAGIRSLKSTMINDIEIFENGGIVGKALESSAGKNMIKVFVNCK